MKKMAFVTPPPIATIAGNFVALARAFPKNRLRPVERTARVGGRLYFYLGRGRWTCDVSSTKCRTDPREYRRRDGTTDIINHLDGLQALGLITDPAPFRELRKTFDRAVDKAEGIHTILTIMRAQSISSSDVAKACRAR